MDNQGGNFFVGKNGDNDYWWAWGDSEAYMISEMKALETAKRLTERKAIGHKGYLAAYNNCLDNAAVIGDAYGAPVPSWGRHSPHIPGLLNPAMAPRVYFYTVLAKYEPTGM